MADNRRLTCFRPTACYLRVGRTVRNHQQLEKLMTKKRVQIDHVVIYNSHKPPMDFCHIYETPEEAEAAFRFMVGLLLTVEDAARNWNEQAGGRTISAWVDEAVDAMSFHGEDHNKMVIIRRRENGQVISPAKDTE